MGETHRDRKGLKETGGYCERLRRLTETAGDYETHRDWGRLRDSQRLSETVRDSQRLSVTETVRDSQRLGETHRDWGRLTETVRDSETG